MRRRSITTTVCTLMLAVVLAASPLQALASTPTPTNPGNPLPLAPWGTIALFVSPHPDDDVFSMGATIAANVNAGREVHVILVSDGEASFLRDTYYNSAAYGDIPYGRRMEFIVAMEQLSGISRTSFANPASMFQTHHLGVCGTSPVPSGPLGPAMSFNGDQVTRIAYQSSTAFYDSRLVYGAGQYNATNSVAGSHHLQSVLLNMVNNIESSRGKPIGLMMTTVPYTSQPSAQRPAGTDIFVSAGKESGYYDSFILDSAQYYSERYPDHSVVANAVLSIAKYSNGQTRYKQMRTYLGSIKGHTNDVGAQAVYSAYNAAAQTKVSNALALGYNFYAAQSVVDYHTAVTGNPGREYMVPSEYYVRSGNSFYESNAYQRFDTASRYQTSAQIATTFFNAATTTVVIARGDTYADSITAVGLAGAYDAPVLLTSPTSLLAATSSVLASLSPSTVFIIGGPDAISEGVRSAIQAAVPNASVSRRYGNTRYDTAVAVYNQIVAKKGAPTQVFLCTGTNYPDALAASLVSARRGIPVLTVPGTAATADMAALGAIAQGTRYAVQKVYLVGGTDALSEVYRNAACSSFNVTSPNVMRFSGADRYETAWLVNTFESYGGSALTVSSFGLISLGDFPDPISASAAMAHKGGALLYVDSSNTVSTTMTNTFEWFADYITADFISNGRNYGHYVFGDRTVVGAVPEEGLHILIGKHFWQW